MATSGVTSEQQYADYCRDVLPKEIVHKLEAGAFQSLCKHLQERSDEVQNIDLMTLSGFCRNCLAKWMVLEARRLVDQGEEPLSDEVIQALNAMGYEEAAQHVYGMTYDEWKQRHQKKATDEQMSAYNGSVPLQAKHDKNLLATRAKLLKKPVPLSNVCCHDEAIAVPSTKPRDSRMVGAFQPPPLPSNLPAIVRVGILTVSDRAFRNEYTTGDLSGPAVVEAVQRILANGVTTSIVVVPDETDAIQAQLRTWSSHDDETNMHIILTTGGTGWSPRDVTPEATRTVLDQECAGLMAFCTTECSRIQPLSSLSRGTAGVMNKSLVANLPGNPQGVSEVVPILFPLLLHALVDLMSL